MAPAMKKSASKKVNHVARHCKIIKEGIHGAEGCAKNVKDILIKTMGDTVGVFKAARHPFNERLVAMMGEVLNAEHKRLIKDVNDKQKEFDQLVPARTAREGAVEEAKADAAAKAEAFSAAKAAAAEVVQPLKEAAAAVKEAEKAQKQGDAAATQIAGKKAALEEVQSQSLAPLLDGSGEEDGKLKKVKAVLEAGKNYDFDASLLSTAEPVLERSVAERGSFDQVCLERLQAAFAAAIAGLDEQLAAEAPGKAERAQAVANAQAAKEALEAQQADLKGKAQAAKESKQGADGALKAAESSLDNFMPELKNAGDASDSSKKDLQEFIDGALKCYGVLKDLTEETFKEPEPVPEPEAATGSPEKRARTSEAGQGAQA